MTCKSIFEWSFLHTIEASIVTENNALCSGILGEPFILKMMVPQRDKDTPKTSEGLQVPLPAAINIYIYIT